MLVTGCRISDTDLHGHIRRRQIHITTLQKIQQDRQSNNKAVRGGGGGGCTLQSVKTNMLTARERRQRQSHCTKEIGKEGEHNAIMQIGNSSIGGGAKTTPVIVLSLITKEIEKSEPKSTKTQA